MHRLTTVQFGGALGTAIYETSNSSCQCVSNQSSSRPLRRGPRTLNIHGHARPPQYPSRHRDQGNTPRLEDGSDCPYSPTKLDSLDKSGRGHSRSAKAASTRVL